VLPVHLHRRCHLTLNAPLPGGILQARPLRIHYSGFNKVLQQGLNNGAMSDNGENL
jgi:hypothetical protein